MGKSYERRGKGLKTPTGKLSLLEPLRGEKRKEASFRKKETGETRGLQKNFGPAEGEKKKRKKDSVNQFGTKGGKEGRVWEPAEGKKTPPRKTPPHQLLYKGKKKKGDVTRKRGRRRGIKYLRTPHPP